MNRQTTSAIRRHRRRGAEIIEFVFVLPVMAFLMSFVFDMSRVVLVQGDAQNAVFRSARVSAANGDALRVINNNGSVGQAYRVAWRQAMEGSDAERLTQHNQLTVVENCTSPSSAPGGPFVVVEFEYDITMATPGAARMLNAFTRGNLDLGYGNGLWRQTSRAVARCEIVR